MTERITPEEVNALKLPRLNVAKRNRIIGHYASQLKKGVPEFEDLRITSRSTLWTLASSRQLLDTIQSTVEKTAQFTDELTEELRFWQTGVSDESMQEALFTREQLGE